MTKSRLVTTVVAIALGAITACGGQQVQPAKTPAPQKKVEKANTVDLTACYKEAPVSGAPCLDALTLHMCAVGCKEITVRGNSQTGPLFFTCSHSVRAPYNQSFIAVPAPNVIQHPAVEPWCVDGTMFMVTGDLQYPGDEK